MSQKRRKKVYKGTQNRVSLMVTHTGISVTRTGKREGEKKVHVLLKSKQINTKRLSFLQIRQATGYG